MVEDIIDEKNEKIETGNNIYSVGNVTSINGGNITVNGLNNISFFESVVVLNKARGYVTNILDDSVIINICEQTDDIKIGDQVYGLNKQFKSSFSWDSLGKVIDIFGNDLIANKRFSNLIEFDIEKEPIDIINRAPVKEELLTGISGIDLFYPIGKGQRQLILGDKKTGKTQIVLDTILNQKDKNVLCLYVAIGKTKKEVKDIYYDLSKRGCLNYTIIIAAFADENPAKCFLTPYAVTSFARFLADLGVDTLVMIDDLKRHADIYRQMSLSNKKTPGRDAYPADIFYAHARLLENGCNLRNGGSITMLPIVEIKNSDVTDYISTNIISICDGQLVLSSKKFNKGEIPAIEYGLSVSRLGGAVQDKRMKDVGIKARTELLSYLEIRDIYELVNLDDLGENVKKRMESGSLMLSKLNQLKYSPKTKEEMIKLFEDGEKNDNR